MDLGFAGLIEEIEKRFGRIVTNLVLICLLFLILTWVVSTIVTFYIEGKLAWDSGSNGDYFWIIKFFLAHVMVTGISIVFFFSVKRHINLRIQRKAREDLMKIHQKNMNEIRELSNRHRKDLERYVIRRFEEIIEENKDNTSS